MRRSTHSGLWGCTELRELTLSNNLQLTGDLEPLRGCMALRGCMELRVENTQLVISDKDGRFTFTD